VKVAFQAGADRRHIRIPGATRVLTLGVFCFESLMLLMS
jgi:hypothetical protein